MTTTWTITVRPSGLAFRLTAVSPDRTRIIHADKLTAEQVESFDPEADFAFATQKMAAKR